MTVRNVTAHSNEWTCGAIPPPPHTAAWHAHVSYYFRLSSITQEMFRIPGLLLCILVTQAWHNRPTAAEDSHRQALTAFCRSSKIWRFLFALLVISMFWRNILPSYSRSLRTFYLPIQHHKPQDSHCYSKTQNIKKIWLKDCKIFLFCWIVRKPKELKRYRITITKRNPKVTHPQFVYSINRSRLIQGCW